MEGLVVERRLTMTVNQRKLTSMIIQSLGDVIRQLREKANWSLRELATKVDISAPFLSDIELGKRYPSDDVLRELARHLKTTLDDLKQYDVRPAYIDIRKMMESNPRLGFAFRTVAEQIKKGDITPDEVIKNLSRKSSGK